ncbi:MAG: glutathione S-transferase family protein [Pseudomonadota bacterium]
MTSRALLHGYSYSVYNRVARLALEIKGVDYRTVEVNPFEHLSEDYLRLHPFGRVPVLSHDGFDLFETGAITRYVDRAFAGPALQPAAPASTARMDQVIAVIDNYGYWPMVRQVFSHGYFQPLVRLQAVRAEVEADLNASRKVLSFLEGVVTEGLILDGRNLTLADCHLAPMLDYFTRAEEGRAALAEHPALAAWWDAVAGSSAMQATDPLRDGLSAD